MHYYFTAVSLVAGICLGFGILYLFVGLRRKDKKPLNLTFAIFALSYAATLFNGIRWYSTTIVTEYIAINRFDSIFVTGAFVGLIWYISYYTGFQPRIFLWVLSAAFIVTNLVLIISPTTYNGEVSGLIYIILPWGEKLATLVSSGSVWLDIHLIARLVSLGYIIISLIRQFWLGERQPAIILGLGMLPFVAGIFYEALGTSGFVPFIPFGEFGFLGIAIAASLQMANSVIKTEVALEQHRHNLEGLVKERTTELEQTNLQLTQEINQRQLVEADLRQSERQARALLNAPPDTTLLLEPDGTILEINEIGAQNLGVSMTEAIGTNAFDLFGMELAQLRRDKAVLAMTMKQAVRWEDERDGRHYANNMYPILDDEGNVASIAVFAVDITEQKRLREKERETAAAEERSRLARDLHDAVTQTIYSASLIAEVLPAVWERNPQEGQRNLVKLRQLVRGALAEMRTLLFELRPSALEAAELSTLLTYQCDALTGRTRIPVAVSIEGDIELPQEVKLALYRILQETCNNIVKHSEATEVDVKLRSSSDQVILSVRDNGRGFDPNAVSEDKLGLRIMAERASEIGARFDVRSSQGEGTQISVFWPEESSALHQDS
jgi:PAS domain S-box-containing protein